MYRVQGISIYMFIDLGITEKESMLDWKSIIVKNDSLKENGHR